MHFIQGMPNFVFEPEIKLMMQNLKLLHSILLFTSALMLASCKKDEVESFPEEVTESGPFYKKLVTDDLKMPIST
jgi:hypothetical protein